MRFSRLTLSAGLPHSWIWRDENGSLYLSSLPLSLPLSLASGYFDCSPFYSEIKKCLKFMLVFKAYELKKHKINKSINKTRKFIHHA